MRSWWKNPLVIGNFAYVVMLCLRFTLRSKFIRHHEIDPNTTYLFAFWHGKQLLPAMLTIPTHKTPICALVSPSRDGGMLKIFLQKMGYQVIRGSSRDNGTRALLKMKTLLHKGISIGFAVDGPIGPIYQIKPGIVFLAKKLNVKIIPVGTAFSASWTFHKAWDKFQVPKPFAKAALVFAQPLAIAPDEDVDEACAKIEKVLHSTEAQAAALVK